MSKLGEALLMAFGMFWQTGWSLVLGFTISSILQATVSADQMRRALGRGGALAVYLFWLNRKNPMDHQGHAHHAHRPAESSGQLVHSKGHGHGQPSV